MIGRFWHWLTDAHRHEWEIMREEPYHNFSIASVGGEKIKTGEGVLYTLRCKACGEITTRKAGV